MDLSHSRMLHWQVVAVGKKGAQKSYSVDVSSPEPPEQGSPDDGAHRNMFICCQVTRNVMRAGLPLPPGDIYNLTVTACTERSRNTSVPTIIKLGQNSDWFNRSGLYRCSGS